MHATHGSGAELQGVQRSGAAIVLCPSTEANLGDGIFDLSAYADVAGNWSIGSDSHVTRSWSEELRLLEYGQRLGLRQRNIAARSAGVDSSAAALFNAALAGGSAATGLALGGIARGQRADFLVLDRAAPALLGIAPEHRLDALVFSSPDAGFSEVYVAGRCRVAQGRVCGASAGDDLWQLLAADFSAAMQALWAKA